MKKLVRIVGWILLASIVLVAGALNWGFLTANGRYNHTWAIHDATFPIPFPIDAAARSALPPGTSDQAADSLAMTMAVASGDPLLHTRLPCGDCHRKDLGGGVVIDQFPIVGYWAA